MKTTTILLLLIGVTGCAGPMETTTTTRMGLTGQPETITVKRPVQDPWDVGLAQAAAQITTLMGGQP